MQELAQLDDIKARQKSCYVKDLKLKGDEVPEFMKKGEFVKEEDRTNIRDAMFVDLNDAELQKWKENLVGDLQENVKESVKLSDPIPAPFVEVKSIEMVCPERPAGNIVLDLSRSEDGSHKVNNEYVLKQGSRNSLRITFRIHNDIVHGLKYCVIVKTKVMGIEKVVDNDTEVIGSYAPTKQDHVFSLAAQEVPSGFLARGSCSGTALLVDLDGNVHLQYEFKFRIEKDW